MFFNDFLVNNEILGPVWRAGNSFSEEIKENTSFPIICRNLDRWVSSESMDVSRRLSLRTSAVLIDGAAKLYKKKLEQLVKDVAKLDEEMIFRNKRESTADDTSITSSGSFDTPEQMMRRAEIQPDISFEAPTRNPTISPPTIRRNYSFMTSTPSPSKQKKEFIDYGSPKKRATDSDNSKETLYPNSRSNDSDQYTEKTSLSSSDRQTDYYEKISDQTHIEADGSNKSNGNSDQSSQTSSDHRNLSDSDQQTAIKHSDQQNIASSDDMLSNFEILKRSSLGFGERSQSSPTFTEIFHNVASLPNNSEIKTKTNHQTDIRNVIDRDSKTDAGNKTYDTKSDRSSDRSSDRRADVEKSSDLRTVVEHDGGSQVSHRSLILKTTKKSYPKLRRKKKASKPIKILKDQATQAVSFYPRTDERVNNSLNESLPFAYLLIHDSLQSRFPSKIVISSLKEDVNNLVCL